MANSVQIEKISFNSIENMNQLISGINLDSVQLNADGTPKGEMLQVSAPEIQVGFGQLNAEFRSKGIMHTDKVTLGINLCSEAKILQWGHLSMPGDVFIFPPGVEQDAVSIGEIYFATLTISIDSLIKYGARDMLYGDKGLWEHPYLFRTSPELYTVLRKTLMHVESQLRYPDFALSDKQLASFQYDLVESFLCGIVYDEKRCVKKHTLSHAQIVRQAEDWMEGRIAQSIHIADLCNALDISRRTLQRAFKNTLGMGPAHYLKLKRMSAVRAELKNLDPAITTVTDVAMSYGFWELGRFAVEYRRIFNEKPSETLYGYF
ncbi:helix-turn-helix domain-containing protein [Catalinimonas sp. 4WD22]|uniref:helix-turn-helix domain-containing protein n=1 Tax=Catalinimonas locisalis TaxID=3133978 RepID=UPI00310114EA